MTGEAFGSTLDPDGAARVEAIVDRMSLAEAVGQMVGVAPHEDVDRLCREIREHHLGSVHFGGTPHSTPREAAAVANAAQEAALDASRFDVPLFLRAMAEHGHAAVAGSTVFPQQLGLAATRNPDLVERCAGVAAAELRATGVHQTSSPIGDVARDQRWGRIPETFGESPYLCARLTDAMVRGYQEADPPALAVAKHFPMYSEGVAGEDQAPNDVSAYTMRRVHLPPHAAAVEAGAGGIMPCYNAIEGEPVHGSARFLDDLLREELGFGGYVLADYRGAEDLHGGHRTSGSREESLWQAVRAGIDCFPAGGPEYAELLVGLVEDGELPRARIDASARRLLRTKVAMGLFEDPRVDPDEAVATLGDEAHREVAREAVRESVTLLENDGLLPLAGPDEVFVTGANADDLPAQHGGWGQVRDPAPLGETVLEGIRSVAGSGTTVTHEPGATITEPIDVDAARTRAEAADVAVAVVGEPDYVHEFIGEGVESAEAFPNREELRLPAAQRDLVAAVAEEAPTVVVLVTGRVLATPWIAEHAPAVVMAYQPGSEGRPVAEALFGELNPSGRLPVSVPRREGQVPVRFNHLTHPTIDDPNHLDAYDPLYEYGHGLSYTRFEREGLTVTPDEVGPAGTVDIAVTVTNAGDRAGTETVELFATDLLGSRVTPVRELVAVRRVDLDPGERHTVEFALDVEALGVYRDGDREVEPGTFELSTGELRASFEVVRRRPYGRE